MAISCKKKKRSPCFDTISNVSCVLLYFLTPQHQTTHTHTHHTHLSGFSLGFQCFSHTCTHMHTHAHMHLQSTVILRVV